MAELTERNRLACIHLIRLAGRRQALRGEFDPMCLNTPAVLGMSDDEIRRHWTAAADRARHLLGVIRQA